LGVPITESNISLEWSTSFFAVVLSTNEPSDSFYTLDGSDPMTSPTRQTYIDPFIIKDDGITTVRYYSISHSTSESNTVRSEDVKIDSISPITTVSASFPSDGENDWYISEPTITLSAVDAVSGVNKTYYAWDGNDFQEYTGGILTIPNEGIHYLQVYSDDIASNREELQTNIFKLDLLSPTTAIDVPLTVVHEPVTIEFIPSDSASGVATTYYTIDGSTPTIDSDKGFSFEIDESGYYVVKYFSVDIAGNVESIKESVPFRVEIEEEDLQILIAESFPINGENGWYRSSPEISLLSSKPHLLTELKYKVAPKIKPTTAEYTSTIEFTGELDLSEGSFIGLEIDHSGQTLIVNIRGTIITRTTITDVINKINATYGEPDICRETGPDGLEGTGYITITSPTAGTGDPNSEVKFVSPGKYDATENVFGLDIDSYPHTFTETYLYENYTGPFLLPGDNIWNVIASATTELNETATISKDYNIDGTDPETAITITPNPNEYGYYTTSPDISFEAADDTSGIYKIVYQFDEGPTLEYHPEDGPIQLPDISKIIRLLYFSVDIASNIESPHELFFDYDFLAPATEPDIDAINNDPFNTIDIWFSLAKVVEYNPTTEEYEFSLLTPSLRQNFDRFANWNDLTLHLNSVARDTTSITFIANPTTDILTVTSHSLQTGDVIIVETDDLLPHPLLPDTYYYIINVSSTELQLAMTYDDAISTNPILINTTGSGNHNILPQMPEIILYEPLNFYLLPIDDREHDVTDETVLVKDETKNELTVENRVLKTVASITNVTTASSLTVQYFSDDKVYTVEPFLNTDTIEITYTYTAVKEIHYTIDGSLPTTLSPTGQKIVLTSGFYTIKWFAIDEAGNSEDVQTFKASVTIINRKPIVNTTIVKSTDTNTDYNATGDNNWYKYSVSEPTLRPAIRVEFWSPNVYIFNEDSTQIGYTGSGPYNVEFQVLELDLSFEVLTNVIRVRNVTKAEDYSITSFTNDRIFADAVVAPDIGDVFEIDYTYGTIDNTAFGSKEIKIGDVEAPYQVIDFSTATSPFYYNSYDYQGEFDVTIFVTDKRNKTTVDDSIPQLNNGNLLKLDTFAPETTDDVSPGWVSTSVNVTLVSQDYSILPSGELPSGVARIYYSTDGTFPNTIYVVGSVANILLENTGEYVVRYRAIDFAGNDELVKQSTVVQIDKDPPETIVDVIPPDGYNGWYQTSPSILLTASDDHSGIDKTYYKWDDDPSFTEYVGSFLIPSEGEHTLFYYSIDNVGNVESTKTEVFKLDATPPVTVDNITTDWTNNSFIQLSISDNASGLYRTYYTLALDGDPLPDPNLTSPFTINGHIPVNTSGIYNLKYFSVDIAGNEESVKTAIEQLHLDLTKPTVIAISPPDLNFTTETHLTIDFDDTFSGINIDTVKVFVDEVEYSTSKNSAYFSSSGTPQNLQVQIGPIASIPNFDVIDTVVIYTDDIAGNSAYPAVVRVILPDETVPYIKGFWPRDKAKDVSRDTNVMFFINDDVSGVDLRTVKVKIANNDYQLVTTNVLDIEYTGSNIDDVRLSIQNFIFNITVNGITIVTLNLTRDEYNTVKKVQLYLDELTNFNASVIDKSYDQLSSIDIIPVVNTPIAFDITLAVARFEDNLYFNFIPRSRGYLIAITPRETFRDKYTVNVAIDASDFFGNAMLTEKYSFVCRDVSTPPRSIRNKWYKKHSDIIKRIRQNLESTYNHETDSTVFYGYFKMLAEEISKSMQLAEDYRDNIYYDYDDTGLYDDGNVLQSELLYQNLGYLLKTAPKEDWSHERYREILLTLMQMFFKGSTRESLLEGLAVFLDVKAIYISEDYLEDRSTINIKEHTGQIEQQFMFTFDIDIGDEPLQNWDSFNDSIQSALSLVKPAHTYFLVRYLFSDIVRTQNIIDEIVYWNLTFYGSEDVRTDCANKYSVAEIITEDVSNQFNGLNNCCTAFYKPILSWDELSITDDPTDIQLEVWRDPSTLIDDFSSFNSANWSGSGTVIGGLLTDTGGQPIVLVPRLADPEPTTAVRIDIDLVFRFQQSSSISENPYIFWSGPSDKIGNIIAIKWQQSTISPYNNRIHVEGVNNLLNPTGLGQNIIYDNTDDDVEKSISLVLEYYDNRLKIYIDTILVCDGHYSIGTNFENYNLLAHTGISNNYSHINQFGITGKFFDEVINITSVNGFTGEICLNRNPLFDENVKIIYKFNKFIIYRKLSFYLNTYTITGSNFNLSEPYLLNQVGISPNIIISYDNPEQMHAHICETGIFIDVNYGTLKEDKYITPREEVSYYVNETKEETIDFHIQENFNLTVSILREIVSLKPTEKLMSISTNLSEHVGTLDSFGSELGVAVESNSPSALFITNNIDSLTNTSTNLLFFWIERTFGGI